MIFDYFLSCYFSIDPNKFITKIRLAEFTEKIDCPIWNQLLNGIFNNDKELIQFIQKAIGYSLTGSTAEQCKFFCYDTGRNGKNTFLKRDY